MILPSRRELNRSPNPSPFFVLVHPALQIPQGIMAEPQIILGKRAGREARRPCSSTSPRLLPAPWGRRGALRHRARRCPE